jgi:hypothetical protein
VGSQPDGALVGAGIAGRGFGALASNVRRSGFAGAAGGASPLGVVAGAALAPAPSAAAFAAASASARAVLAERTMRRTFGAGVSA